MPSPEAIGLVFDPAERQLLRVCEVYGWKLTHWRLQARGAQLFFSRGEIPPDVARIARGDLLKFARSLLAGHVETPRATKAFRRSRERAEEPATILSAAE